jgi:hypothetical protein
MIPKDINYQYGNGKISYYAHNGIIDASGYKNDIVIGGSEENVPEDNKGPEIKLYLNNENFVRGGVTNDVKSPSPKFDVRNDANPTSPAINENRGNTVTEPKVNEGRGNTVVEPRSNFDNPNVTAPGRGGNTNPYNNNQQTPDVRGNNNGFKRFRFIKHQLFRR